MDATVRAHRSAQFIITISGMFENLMVEQCSQLPEMNVVLAAKAFLPPLPDAQHRLCPAHEGTSSFSTKLFSLTLVKLQ